ncbi:hypothetical protein CC85DRAFT_283529 [Cutaneotrichosporon oleaginosum]|uniref:DNA replication factor Cdt1 C-terminal domain-containing protein n=1 Tax=Cutaneotrichosporon oleaginosum TaxID=879819 RepID=A0A0J0XU25_9TREE|nr:uncharacterized protein CC85DRAFT_283529 [Cutaneotrichosporon oleaginosum]KLT44596.1 hypothetical protein CC85DRAFT_283529 [Cutaneotrichosporon oleaginosum]TXT13889.1 hypothetical protein COLE_00082 [Cutaneotrichosporon oleaginosum]
MSGVQATPGKRGAKRALPPNTPSSLPPTPQTRRRRDDDDDDDSQDSQPPAKRQLVAPRSSLPEHLANLLTLHHAFNIALSLHIAQHPPVLPPHSASATRVGVPNVTTFHALRSVVERTAGRRFGREELARLAWLWTWDGESLPADTEDDNPFLVRPAVESVSGLSYLITVTRTLEAGRRVHTHGIGIELEIQAGETRQLLLGGAPGGLGNRGQGGGMRLMGRWNAGADLRQDEVRRRLERWVELNGGEVTPLETAHLPTPTTRTSGRSAIPPIPLLPLPKFPSVPSAGNLFSSPAMSEMGLTSSPKKPTLLSDPFEIKEKPAAGTPEERKKALFARIKARSRPTFSESLASSSGVIHRRSDQEELKRRATLSRLEGVAEGVWMMFSAPPPGSGSGTPRARRRALPFSEVAETVVQSSKTPISIAEAETSLQMLVDLCPFFVTSKRVGRHDWLELRAEPPSSPGSVLSSPGIAGPASPGRVRRTGGLREVRERIRRELGEA